MEVHARSARLTDLAAAVRMLAREGDEEDERRDDVDYLRNLLFVPSATVSVAELDRRVVGVGVLAIRPSVRSGPFVGIIDELGIAGAPTLDAAGSSTQSSSTSPLRQETKAAHAWRSPNRWHPQNRRSGSGWGSRAAVER